MKGKKMYGQFTSIPNILFSDERLPRSCIIVYGVLQSRAGKNGQIFPSYKTIADDAGITRKTAITAVKTLLKCGYIAKETRFSDDRGCMTSNFYYLNPNPQVFSLKQNVDKSESYPQPSVKNYTTPSVKITPQPNSKLNIKKCAHKDNIIYLPIRTRENPASDSDGEKGGNRPSVCGNIEKNLGQASTKKLTSAFDATVATESVENYMQK